MVDVLQYGLSEQQESKMGYRITNKIDGHGPRRGLEGPFQYASGRVLYYDPSQGRYWDPRTDFYVSQEEMDAEHGILVQRLVDMSR